MKAHAVSAAGAFGAFGFTLLVGWYDGVDYLVRGKEQVFWTVEGVLAALTAYLFIRMKFLSAFPTLGPRWARIICTACAFILVVAEAWYGGANPFERGHGQGGILYMSLAAAFACWACPLWTPIGVEGSRPSS